MTCPSWVALHGIAHSFIELHKPLRHNKAVSSMILEGTESLVKVGLRSGFLEASSTKQFCVKTPVTGHNDCGLAELCEMAKCFSTVNEREQRAVFMMDEETSIPEQVQLSCVTENTTNYAKIITLMGQKYLFPPKSAFLLSDISFIQPLLDYNKKFGIIVIDPPWENKSVKRSNRYGYLSHWQIKQIPVPALAAPDCLVVTWVTNRQKHLRFVKNELYPHWCVHGVVEWFWVKITRSGEFIFPLDSFHKRPYEILVLGRVKQHPDIPLRISEDGVCPAIPDHKLIVSVPCTLHSHKPPLTGEAVAVLNRCLAEVMGWMRANKLKLNPDKTEVLLVGGSGFGEGELNLVLNGVALPPRDKVRSLGVLLDSELSLEAQVTTAARSAFLQLRLIHQLRPYLEYDCLATVTHALVTSRLDFCNALYVGLPLKTVRILQLVQNRAARLLTGTGRYVHMTPVLRQLHWLPIEVRAQFKVLVMTYKALNGLGPGYLKERLHPYLPKILKGYTKPDVECLELFARNLHPGWTSWGNEVLKFQHMDYFRTLQNRRD
ncbi:Methyltransferase-like protein 4 [Varanus komodoensis]|nr:Methyltransferase-like protein 4 [Varanus komodoensis]